MLADYKRFLGLLQVENGKSFRIRPFQEAILRDHFGAAVISPSGVFVPTETCRLGQLAAAQLNVNHSKGDREHVR
jgi:hypothetical protein